MRTTLSVVVVLIVIGFIAINPTSAEEVTTPTDLGRYDLVLSDLFVIRPLCAVGASITTSLFVLSLPVSYQVDRGYDALEYLVEKPWGYVSNRPLGVFQPEESKARIFNPEINQQYQRILKRTFLDGPLKDIK